MEETEKNLIRAEMIVDLYEARVASIHKYLPVYEKVQDAHHYNFLSSVIAMLCDKYQIPRECIDEVIRNRSSPSLTSLKENNG